MGYHCNPRDVPLASSEEIHGDAVDDDNRFEQLKVSLHCYIWTGAAPFRDLRDDRCKNCCEKKILDRVFERELPAHVKRRILSISHGDPGGKFCRERGRKASIV